MREGCGFAWLKRLKSFFWPSSDFFDQTLASLTHLAEAVEELLLALLRDADARVVHLPRCAQARRYARARAPLRTRAPLCVVPYSCAVGHTRRPPQAVACACARQRRHCAHYRHAHTRCYTHTHLYAQARAVTHTQSQAKTPPATSGCGRWTAAYACVRSKKESHAHREAHLRRLPRTSHA